MFLDVFVDALINFNFDLTEVVRSLQFPSYHQRTWILGRVLLFFDTIEWYAGIGPQKNLLQSGRLLLLNRLFALLKEGIETLLDTSPSREDKERRERYDARHLRMGTIKSYLMQRLNNGRMGNTEAVLDFCHCCS